MARTLLEDTSGFNLLTRAANALEERWHNAGVTKSIQHKAVLGLMRHLGSPEGMFTLMPTGMARQLKPKDPMVKEMIDRFTAMPKKDIPSSFHPKYKDAPQRQLEDMMIKLHELRKPVGKVEQARFLAERQQKRALEEYRRLGTTKVGTETNVRTTFQTLMDLINR
jgi:hypothetical protein